MYSRNQEHHLRFTIDNLINSGNGYYQVWDNQPGGRVVRRFQEDGVKYVAVEFENSPGEEYIYLAGE